MLMAMAGSSNDEEKGATLDDSFMASFSNTNISSPAHFTVWRQSLLFNGNGYTVYDNLDGSLVYRVDNYACDWKQQMFLMDSYGHVLFTICRRSGCRRSGCRRSGCRHGMKLSILESWEAFKGEKDDVVRYGGRYEKAPFMVATKAFRNHSCSITVATTGDKYRIKWSSQEGWSKIFPEAAATLPIAQVRRKCGTAPESSSLGKDVFTLIVHPRVDQAMVMAMLMISNAMR